MGVQVLRVNLQPAFTHIFRSCSWPIVHEWAGMLQADITALLGETLSAPLVGPTVQLVVAMPLRLAGLGWATGILNFQYEAALHSLQGPGSLGTRCSCCLTLANSEIWSDEVSKAMGS